MVVEKNSNLVKVFKELMKENLSASHDFEVKNVRFVEGLGVKVYFVDPKVEKLIVKDTSVDFDAMVPGNIIPLILSEIADKETIEIKKEDGNVKVNNWKIQTSGVYSGSDDCEPEYTTSVSFPKEQFKSFEKDFDITIGNYFSNKKTVNVIGFAFKDNVLYGLYPSENFYKISKLKDASYPETKIFLLPKKIYDIVKVADEDVEISFGDVVKIESGDITVKYSPVPFGTNVFVKYLTKANEITEAKDMNIIRSAVSEFNNFQNYQNDFATITIKDNKLMVFEFEKDIDVDISLSTNLLPLVDLYKMYDNGEIYLSNDSPIIFKNGDDTVVLPNLSYR